MMFWNNKIAIITHITLWNLPNRFIIYFVICIIFKSTRNFFSDLVLQINQRYYEFKIRNYTTLFSHSLCLLYVYQWWVSNHWRNLRSVALFCMAHLLKHISLEKLKLISDLTLNWDYNSMIAQKNENKKKLTDIIL